jgi:excisionase family DNA binding protein
MLFSELNGKLSFVSAGILEKEQVVKSILRLRQVVPDLDENGRAALYPVISMLEDAAGPTLSQSEVGRLLGVSHTTVRRWIEKGDIPTVPTPRGRNEISLGQAVGLLESVEEISGISRNRALARVMHDQRNEAAAMDVTSLLPARLANDVEGHRKAELRSLAYHRAVAQRLDQRILSDARQRLGRWEREGRIHPTWAAEWRRVLDEPEDQIVRVLSSDSEASAALRQSSPFAGVLTEHERRRVIEGVENRE